MMSYQIYVRCAVVGPATEHDDVEVHRTLLGGDQWLAEDVVHSRHSDHAVDGRAAHLVI